MSPPSWGVTASEAPGNSHLVNRLVANLTGFKLLVNERPTSPRADFTITSSPVVISLSRPAHWKIPRTSGVESPRATVAQRVMTLPLPVFGTAVVVQTRETWGHSSGICPRHDQPRLPKILTTGLILWEERKFFSMGHSKGS